MANLLRPKYLGLAPMGIGLVSLPSAMGVGGPSPDFHQWAEGLSVYIYFIRANTARWCRVKIGYAKDVEERLAALQTGSPVELELMGTLACESLKHAQSVEKQLHGTFREYGTGGEWFTLAQPLREFIAATITGDRGKAASSLVWAERQMRKRNKRRFYVKSR